MKKTLKDYYMELLSSGEFFNHYPNFTGIWEIDQVKWVEMQKSKEMESAQCVELKQENFHPLYKSYKSEYIKEFSLMIMIQNLQLQMQLFNGMSPDGAHITMDDVREKLNAIK